MSSKNLSANKRFIPYGRQSVDSADIRAVVSVLRSDWLTQGPMVNRFEEAFAKYCQVPYAVAVANGTAGLHLASLAAGFTNGGEVVTTPMTFAATANAILYAGAKPRFADIEGDFADIDPDKVRGAMTSKTRGIIHTHFAGHPSLIGPKIKFSSKRDFFVIEDACHALGALYRSGASWKKIGSCENADMSVFSFHPVKHLTTGEGGMITTRRKDLYEKLLLLRSHGIEKNPGKFIHKNARRYPWYYEMQALGFNYRITDFQCALGLSQLKRLDAVVSKRREIAKYYDEHLHGIEGLNLPPESPGCRSSYHLYVLRINFKKIKKTREGLMNSLRQRGVGTQVHYIPLVSQPYYEKNLGTHLRDFPVCGRFYEEALSIPIYPGMKAGDCRRVVREMKASLKS